MKNKRLAMLLRLAAVSTVATGLYATALPGTGVGDTALTSQAALNAGSWLILPTALTTTAIDNLAGVISQGVWKETSGTLDFVYQIKVTSGSGVDQLTLKGFAWDNPVSPDQAYYLTAPGPLPNAVFTGSGSGTSPIPDTVNRTGTGDLIHFDWTINPPTQNGFGPGTTAILVVQTSATTYKSANIHLQDSGQLDATGWAPAPEPGTFGLMTGVLGLGLFLARKYRTVQS